MHWFAALFQRMLHFVQPLAEQFGGPGLAVVAFLDSSFVSLPEVADALIAVLAIRHPSHWFYYAMATTAGSVAGCYVLYALARKGGEAFLRKRLRAGHIDRGLAVLRRHGLFALIVPSILPPPMPFKPFILLAGIADVRPVTFLAAVAVGRGFRYAGEAWLVHAYGDQATAFLQDNLTRFSVWVGVTMAVVGLAVVAWRQRGRAEGTAT